MGFRFWRRVKIAPGVTLNLSKSGGSLSFGPRGTRFTTGTRGKRISLGIPGTGLFYSTAFPDKCSENGRSSSHRTSAAPAVSAKDRLTLGFFRRLVTPEDEKALVEGCRELVSGNEDTALQHFEQASHLADSAYLAGFINLRKDRLKKAEEYLKTAAEKHARLDRFFSRHGISAVMILPITDEVSVHIGPNLRGVLLGLVEIYQRQKRRRDAIDCLTRLRRLEPDDVVVKLSFSELLLDLLAGNDAADASLNQKTACRKVVKLAENIDNKTPAHAALMLYKARALRQLDLPVAARDTLTAALRRKKDRPEELLKAIRYERAEIYEDLGRRKQSRGEFEKLYADDPDYEDVAARLGL